MKSVAQGNKPLSIILFLGGIALIVAALVLDCMGSSYEYRGAMLVCGIIGFFLGLYLIPTKKHHRKIVYFIFLFPLLFTFLVTVIFPLVLGIGYSFTDWTGIKFSKFVGFENYISMFKDPAFIWSVLLTFIFVVLNMILVNLIAFLLALLCTSTVRGIGSFRTAYFLPNLIGGLVLGYIWQYAGYIMLIYITGLTQIPGDVLEASSIDGANAIQTLFRIKLPMIASTITICTFLTLTSAFKQFDVNMALTGGTGFVQNFMGSIVTTGTQMLALNIYNTAIRQNNYALGQAKAVLFFIILACVSLIQVRVSNKKEVEM